MRLSMEGYTKGRAVEHDFQRHTPGAPGEPMRPRYRPVLYLPILRSGPPSSPLGSRRLPLYSGGIGGIESAYGCPLHGLVLSYL